jgi:AraC-like DNA-binding protein
MTCPASSRLHALPPSEELDEHIDRVTRDLREHLARRLGEAGLTLHGAAETLAAPPDDHDPSGTISRIRDTIAELDLTVTEILTTTDHLRDLYSSEHQERIRIPPTVTIVTGAALSRGGHLPASNDETGPTWDGPTYQTAIGLHDGTNDVTVDLLHVSPGISNTAAGWPPVPSHPRFHPYPSQDGQRQAPEQDLPATVRRAMTYIDGHAGEDIGVRDIAAAAGIGVRGLQHAFRRHCDITPLSYLHRIRMAAAHDDLTAGDAAYGDHVATIAARWRFAHAGRFSAQYRSIYGCCPSATLRR